MLVAPNSGATIPVHPGDGIAAMKHMYSSKSLFTNVPVQEALEVIHVKLLTDESLGERTALSADHITHLLHLCLRTTYFIYKGQYYQQKDGAAMGSPVSPVVANI